MFIALLACGEDKKNPTEPNKNANIIFIEPKSQWIGEYITTKGTNFGESQGTSFVSFAGTKASVYITWSDNEIVVKVPLEATSGKLWLEVNGEKSNEVDFTIKGNSTEFGTITDIDGNVYKTVKIGNQWWIAENLNVSRYQNGDIIRHALSEADWVDAGEKKEGAWCYYDHNLAIGNIFGKLYNWYAVNDARVLAPSGFHVASDIEWTAITNYLGGEEVAGAKMKDSSHWASLWIRATNESGFTALPGGYINKKGNFINIGSFGKWWSATVFDHTYVLGTYMGYYTTAIYKCIDEKATGFSVRCIKD